MVTNSMNGRAKRPSVGKQIERLDRVLDGLAESIPEAVALAVKEAMAVVVKHAVEVAVAEALREHERRRAETESTPPMPKVQPTTEPTAMAPTTMEQVCGKVKALSATLKGWLTGLVGAAAPRCVLVWQMRRHLVMSLSVGALVGVTAWLLGPMVSAVGVGLFSMASVGWVGLARAGTTSHLNGPT